MPRPPNLLWIVTTQWRAQATGYAGDGNVRTPALDALASCSINYRQAVTPHPFGPFARAALLTGQLSPQNGVRDYSDPLPPEARTVAHALGERGYVTAFFGKWHLGPRPQNVPLVGEKHARLIVPPEHRGGFHFWEGFESGFLINDPWLHGSRLRRPIRLHGYQSDVLTEWVADWLTQQTPPWLTDHAPSWFVMLSLEPPHPPYDAQLPPGVAPLSADRLDLRANVPRGGDVEARARRELSGYYAHIEATDRAIGRLLRNVPPETIVVFTSVHGDMHGSHGLFRKGWPQEESVRVPLLVRAGGPAEVNDVPVSLVDLSDMTIAFAEGRTWRSERSRAEISMPSVVALPDQCDRTWQGWRTATQKNVTGPDGAPWLDFDLQHDPLEQVNRVGSRGV